MKFKLFPKNLFLTAFLSLIFLNAKSQTDCTSGNNALCVDAGADVCASFTGNNVTSISNSNLVFTGTATTTTVALTFLSRTYSITANGCVVVQFDEATSATIAGTDVTIITNSGASLTCSNVTIDGSGHACVRICDPILTTGTLIRFKLDIKASPDFTFGQTATLSNFGTAGTTRCIETNEFPCPSTYLLLNNDCSSSCDPNFTVSGGKIRVYFSLPIPIGQPTPVVTALLSVNGVPPAGQYVFCLDADPGTSVERSYADYCVYTNGLNPSPLLASTGTLTLTLQSGSFSQSCTVTGCASATSIVLSTNDCPSTPSCSGVTGNLAGKVRISFNSPIPIGVATPVITSAVVNGSVLAGYQFCLNADQGSGVERSFADYCIYSTLPSPDFPNNVPIIFNSASGDICTTPVIVPCASGFSVLNNGGALVAGEDSEVPCPAPSTCGPTLNNVVSRVRIYFNPCLPPGVPAPSLNAVEGLNSVGTVVTSLSGRFCFVTTHESDSLLSTSRCFIDYCVYGAAGDTYFNSPDAYIRFTLTYDILANGSQTPFVQMCSPIPGPPAPLPVYNPDINITTVNVPVTGNVSTNDALPAGTTYGLPQPNGSNPSGSTITLNSNGTYTFNATTTAGVYIYRVPVCIPGAITPCPTTELKISVLDTTVSNNPPVANTDIAATFINTPVTIRIIANDKCSNPGCILNGESITITPTQGTAIINGNGDIVYTPNSGFIGTDSLTYQVCENGLCASAKVYIDVISPFGPNTTTAADDYVLTTAGVAVSGNVKTNDMDPVENGQDVTPQNITNGAGTLVLNADGTFTFTPANGFTGPVDFIYTTCDLQIPVACASATLHILVTPLAAPTALPVTLTDFNGVINNKQVVLNWRTSLEINSSHFDVERSSDVVNFQNIGTVSAHGNSSVVNNYHLIDRTPLNGNNYYRLKSVDIDGKYVYSSVIKIYLGDRTNGLITVTPNPTHGAIRVNFNGLENGVYTIVLINQLGQAQMTDKVTISQNNAQRTLRPQGNLAKGIYMLHIYRDGSGRISSKKVVVD